MEDVRTLDKKKKTRITLVQDSAISEILLGCKGRSASLEIIRATTHRLQSPPDFNFCRCTRWSASAVVLHPTDTYERKTKSGLSTGRS